MKTPYSGRAARLAVLTAAVLFALAACQKPEGPVEKFGKKVDNAGSAVGQQIEKAGQQIQDTTKRD